MLSNPLHTATKEGPAMIAAPGAFAINQVKAWGGCDSCSGRTLLEVKDDSKTVVGYLESEYLWTFGIPDDPDEHPPSPHYVMEWLALNPDMELLEDIDTTQSLHFAASALVRRAQATARDEGAT